MVLPHTKMDRPQKPGLKKPDILFPERAWPSFGRPQGRWKPIGESRMSFRVGVNAAMPQNDWRICNKARYQSVQPLT